MNLTRVHLISFPRSGQHMTWKLLFKIFKLQDIPGLTACEFYGCCRSIPCKYGKVIMKNHDFDLNLAFPRSDKVIVLYRKDPILQLEAYYRFENRHRNIQKVTQFKDFRNFYYKNITYYRRFVNKWVREDVPWKSFDYDSYVKHPFETLKSILEYLWPEIKFLDENIQKVIDEIGISYKHFIDEEYYTKLQASLSS